MLIMDFSKVATKVGGVLVTKRLNGYCVEVKGDGWDIICSTVRTEVRYWKSLDTLYKHLTEKGFRGKITIESHTQQSFL